MRSQRSVVYPPRRGHRLADVLLLPVALAVILVAGSIAVIALAAIATITPTAVDPRHDDVAGAAEQIRAAAHPAIRAVAVVPAVLGGHRIMVSLARKAEVADARSAWCEVILATGIGRGYVKVNSGDGEWRAPDDCTDPRSTAEFIAPYD